MGKYKPDDSRDITLNPDTAPGEPARTGPREGETRKSPDEGAKVQSGYGNSRDEDGQMEQDQRRKKGDAGKAPSGNAAGAAMSGDDKMLVDTPDAVARTDANRPL